MSWYRTGTVTVTNGSKTVTGVGTLWTTAVNAGDAFALVDANLNPTGAWYEVESVTNNTTLVLKQSYAGTTGSNKQYCVFNLVGNMTTPSFAQRLATFFASFQSLIDKPTTTPTASSIPIADSSGKIADGWIPATVARLASPTFTGTPKAPTQTASDDSTKLATTAFVKDQVASDTVAGMVELATPAEVLAGTDNERAVTPAGFLSGFRGNLLGTVSESDSIPTGSVIERGSNANGQYVKFADGTMICFVSFSGAMSIVAYGTTGLSFGSVSVTLPATFHTIQGGACGGLDQAVAGIFTYSPASTTTVGIVYYYTLPHSVTWTNGKFVFFGRWF